MQYTPTGIKRTLFEVLPSFKPIKKITDEPGNHVEKQKYEQCFCDSAGGYWSITYMKQAGIQKIFGLCPKTLAINFDA